MFFEKKSAADLDIRKCFLPVRGNFPHNRKSGTKQLSKLINNTVEFYKVYDNRCFIGCLFVNEINETNKIIDFGGFAYRHTNAVAAVKEFVAYLKYRYPDYSIKAATKFRTAKFCLTRAGLKNKNGGYVYD